ncbi:hypothetical protein [uncultured Pseudokineococcus sp.]|uniref:hypothetical protein n=1 Tax=uncultured Pseudokineococcus sp. TaxID=1642928 RepID=UPI00261BE859|nr:hypothetical protein [uncultured Pseudokineococcus sp.]
MPRTTTRRVASTGLGALAATTALALAAPSALAATSSFVLDPGQDVAFSAFGLPLDRDQANELDATPVDLAAGDGTVTVDLPDRAVSADAAAALVTMEDYEDALEVGEVPQPLTLAEELEPKVTDGLLTVVLPAADDALTNVDDVFLLVTGLEVEGFADAPSFEVTVPLDLKPTGDAAELVRTPAAVDASALEAFTFVEEPVAARAGEPFQVVLPEDSSLRGLGVETLEGLDGFLLPLGDDDEEGDLVLESSSAASVVAEAVEGTSASSAATGTARVLEDLEADLEGSASEGDGAEGDVVALDLEDYAGDPETGERSATVRPSEDLRPGSYLMVLFVPSSDDSVSMVAVGELVLEAAAVAPVPTPTVTVTAPAPAPAQNPGLRSNTGVEGGGVDGGLVAAGAALLAVAAGAGAAALRTGRRGRRA